jgi:hypothetical protein
VGQGEWGSGSQGKVGQWVAEESGIVGRRGKWAEGRGAGRGARGAAQVVGREAGRGRKARRGSRGGVNSPPDGSTSGCVRGKRGKRGREGREEVPAHVARKGTVFSPGESGQETESP